MDETLRTSGGPGPGNVPEYSVSEISGAIRRTLEGTFGRVRVRGEITEFKRYSSGHLYFSLKDESGKISGVVWRGSVSRLGLVPENGLEIIATGKVSSYGERSSYQLIVERMEYAGEGALLARIERLRLKLAAEGLFDAARKRALPFLPGVIGIVTSAQGAVLHDIRTTVARRFPRRLLVWPVAVQGEGAAAQIAAAIAGFDAIDGRGAVPRPDVLIVARGGGSLEDLMAFNDEAVLRAVDACRIPLISAVGHETDTTLIDYVSDRRAPTPTAAAEMAVPARAELVADLAHRVARLTSGLTRLTQTTRLRLDRAAARMPDLPSLLATARMRVDDRGERLDRALPGLIERRRAALLATGRMMPSPLLLTGPARARLDLVASHLLSGLRQALRDRRARTDRMRLSAAPLAGMVRERRAHLNGLAGRLESLSPMAVLERGYVLVRDPSGVPVTRAADVRPDGRLELTFADGVAEVRALRPDGSQGRLDL
ncbi:exodeoxyribonuclease VII large subunit [Gluconacetobacter sp. 1b LMG 1731]|uniref:Exodeoxyribonuclease 7 large subunit n=1 Tax=Gluconacetobacter dulcium TaxID=2729096 RepID=A0A7W4IJ06_9PROT|nr:exodeoxyribonuclease VII large subunit [Gluconacetobacter dulcium]MBB2163775.1 exodeoxyribonuclease VII large subunit [Gluconacetobacter dulcium]MBB2193101.1 exodeoxyribonuclease VII large subunit [Gluconacetobacter dulcium]